jgi:thiol-disulfide isomerase/thioredoxin
MGAIKPVTNETFEAGVLQSTRTVPADCWAERCGPSKMIAPILTAIVEEPGEGFLSVHELPGPEVLEDPGYRAAVSTPWRDRLAASGLRRERRAFVLRNAIGA